MTSALHSPVGIDDPWLNIGKHQLVSRLLLGIEQYTDPTLVAKVLEASGTDVFITTYDLEQTRGSLLLDDLDQKIELSRYAWIGTTSFAYSADVAVRTAHHLRATLGLDVIKLDVRDAGNGPDSAATIVAARQLLADGFSIMPFVHPDIHTALELQDMGCSAIRLMASPVGSYRGISDPEAMRRCIDALSVPAVVEGGIGSPTHVAEAMELGAAAVLVNTLVAQAEDPVAMAAAVRQAVSAGIPAVQGS
ncbi:thiamine biosynthesis protein ThiG [Streptomyces sp. 372A]|uniref:thiamine biosynthesis protein ThiG n=1 Tax=Streptomyces sp. SAS_281 TaxID=3412744 RepID=UPI00403C583C